MTYDYWNMLDRSKPKKYSRNWWVFGVLIAYSVIWLIVSFMGLFNMAEVVDRRIILFNNTYFQEIDFISVKTMLSLMLGFPILSMFERLSDNSSALDVSPESSRPKVESA